jgi:thiol-disulfide isomerase/thioredoxin
MQRRTFLTAATASLILPRGALAATGAPYQLGLIEGLLKEGRTVFVDFYTDWCVTCASQSRIIEKLKAENPAYEQKIAFVAVDWDRHSGARIAAKLRVRNRATLMTLKGDEVLGRLEWETREPRIRALLDAALATATS